MIAEHIPINVPDLDPNPDFPLRFHVMVDHFGGFNYRYHGYGSANLIDPTKKTAPQGFNFAFECNVRFVSNSNPTEHYQARWKKFAYELEILTIDGESLDTHTCELHLAQELQPFKPTNTVRYFNRIALSPSQRWTDPDFAYEVADPAYPVQFHVADGERNQDGPTDTGSGTANVSDPGNKAPLQGATYHYDCERGFLNNSQSQNFYQGRWIKRSQKLEILLQRPGSDKVDKCIVDLTLEPQPYEDRWPFSRRNTAPTPAAPREHPNAPTSNFPIVNEPTPPNL